MNLEVEEIGPVQRRLRIEVSTAEVDAAFGVVYRQIGRSARIRGFRPGRVPRSVLEKTYREQAQGAVLQQLVQESLPRAMENAELSPLGEPSIDPREMPRQGAPFLYEATLEIRPTIELQKVSGLSVCRPELPAPDQDPVERHLEELVLTHSQLIEEAEGQVAAQGHVLIIDSEASRAGEPFAPGSGRGMMVEIGSGRSIPGFEDQLTGMQVGQTRRFSLPLPTTGDPAAAQGDPSATFTVSLIGLKRREVPELDDDFAKDVSEFATLAELRADVLERVEAAREAERARLLREAVIGALIEANPFPVPEGLVERQLSGRIERAARQLEGQMAREELEPMLLEWRAEWRPQAEREVRLALMVPEIARSEGLEVSAEDFNAQLRQMAEQQGTSLRNLKRSYREKGLETALKGALLERRVLEFLVSRATLSDG